MCNVLYLYTLVNDNVCKKKGCNTEIIISILCKHLCVLQGHLLYLYCIT